ncbi:unnamed protein product, partial [Discosporangium mesarthrocarpum]
MGTELQKQSDDLCCTMAFDPRGRSGESAGLQPSSPLQRWMLDAESLYLDGRFSACQEFLRQTPPPLPVAQGAAAPQQPSMSLPP